MRTHPDRPPSGSWAYDPATFAQFADNAPETPGRVKVSNDRLSVLQPHPDDIALSIGGLLHRHPGHLTVITAFDDSEERAERDQEDITAVARLSAERVALGLRETTGQSVDSIPDMSGEVWAPAGITRNVDHLAVRDAATRAGCTVFWEDVAFWGIYGSSVEDRILATQRDSDLFEGWIALAIDITPNLSEKVNLLRCYPSQSSEIWRVIRYSWAVGHEVGAPDSYFERLFVAPQRVQELCDTLSVRIAGERSIRYGTVDILTIVTESRTC